MYPKRIKEEGKLVTFVKNSHRYMIANIQKEVIGHTRVSEKLYFGNLNVK